MSDIIPPTRNHSLNMKTRKKVKLMQHLIFAPGNPVSFSPSPAYYTKRTLTTEGKWKIIPAYSSYKGRSLSTASSKMVTRLVRHHDQKDRQSDAARSSLGHDKAEIAESVREQRSTRFLPSNSQSRSKHRETDEQTRRREQTRDNGQNLPALPCKNTPATAGKQNHPAVPVPHTNRGRACSTTKTAYLKTGTNGKLWQHKDVNDSVSSCSLSLFESIQNLFPRMRTACLRIDSASHWTLYNIVFHGMRFNAHRQLMSYLTRNQ